MKKNDTKKLLLIVAVIAGMFLANLPVVTVGLIIRLAISAVAFVLYGRTFNSGVDGIEAGGGNAVGVMILGTGWGVLSMLLIRFIGAGLLGLGKLWAAAFVLICVRRVYKGALGKDQGVA